MISLKSRDFSLLLVAGLLLFSGMKPLHQLKLCVTDINCNGQSAEIEIKLFTDDLEEALAPFCKKSFSFSNGQISQDAINCLQKYLKKNFVMSVNDKAIWLHFKGTQFIHGDVDNDAIKVFCYSAPQMSGAKQIKIKNTLLLNGIPEQINIVNVHFKDETFTVRFDRNDTTEKIINFN